MQNPWTIDLEARAEWAATLPEHTPEHAGWLRTALTQGENLGVYRVLNVSDIGYHRSTDGGLVEFLHAHPEADIGPLFFTYQHGATTLIAFHDAAGNVVEAPLSDLAAALAPFRTPVRHRPPLELTAYDWGSDEPPEVSVSVRTYSDIWLPWTAASHDPDSTVPGFGDNRALARRHTPRLNAFLAALRQATVRLGGRWDLERDSLSHDVAFQVDDHGVLLDAECPPVS